MMIKIEAYIREEKFEDVKAALDDLNVNGLTVYQVMGCGIQRGYQEIVRGMEVDMQPSPPKNGRKKPWRPSGKLPTPVKWATARSSPTPSRPLSRSGPARPATTLSRNQNSGTAARASGIRPTAGKTLERSAPPASWKKISISPSR